MRPAGGHVGELLALLRPHHLHRPVLQIQRQDAPSMEALVCETFLKSLKCIHVYKSMCPDI